MKVDPIRNCDPNSSEYQPWCYLDGGATEDGGVAPPGTTADAGSPGIPLR
jgi:hypothetical protein